MLTRRTLMQFDGSYLKFIEEHTFTNALGSDGRVTIHPKKDYDFLIIVPDITVTAQSGETNGNWLYYGISDGTNSSTNYDGQGGVGNRKTHYTTFVTYDESETKWYICPFAGGRSAYITSTKKMSDLTITFGPYYSANYGYFNGKIKIYGGHYAPRE